MKKLLPLCGLLALCSCALAQWTPVFQDDFSGDLSHWYQHWGSWSISNGELIANYGISCGTPSCSQADLVADVEMPENHWRASLDFTRQRDVSHTTYYQALGCFCMWQDADHRLKFSVGGSGWSSWGGPQTEVSWSVGCRNGGWQGLASGTATLDWVPEEWHTAMLEYDNGVYSLFFDGQFLASYEDTYLYGAGTIGLHTYGTKRWDNFILEEAGQVAAASPVETAFELATPYPNPFNPSTRIRYTLAHTMEARLSVHNLRGREVAVLAEGLQESGAHELAFEASQLPSGVYFFRLQGDGVQQIRKMILAR